MRKASSSSTPFLRRRTRGFTENVCRDFEATIKTMMHGYDTQLDGRMITTKGRGDEVGFEGCGDEAPLGPQLRHPTARMSSRGVRASAVSPQERRRGYERRVDFSFAI